MHNTNNGKQRDPSEKRQGQAQSGGTPGSKGYPEPGSGHDESETVTVEDGPPIKKTDGEPGAFGVIETDRQP